MNNIPCKSGVEEATNKGFNYHVNKYNKKNFKPNKTTQKVNVYLDVFLYANKVISHVS